MPNRRKKKSSSTLARASGPTPRTTNQRQLVALLLGTAGFAVLAGIAMAVQPSGALLRLSDPVAASGAAPYRVPGVLLALIIGGSHLRAALAVLRHDRKALKSAASAGLLLAGYVAAWAMAAGSATWLHPVLLGLAVIELLLVAANLPRRRGAR